MSKPKREIRESPHKKKASHVSEKNEKKNVLTKHTQKASKSSTKNSNSQIIKKSRRSLNVLCVAT